jgi:hypothetical protein
MGGSVRVGWDCVSVESSPGWFTVGYSYQDRRVEVLVPPGCRGLGPLPASAAVRVIELGGDTRLPLAAGAAGGPQDAERSTSDWNGRAGGAVLTLASEWLESRRSTALGIRLPGVVTRATESSPRFLPLRLSRGWRLR